MILMRGTRSPQLLSQCGVPKDKRFTFYDQKTEDGHHVKGLFELLSENEQRERAQAETVSLLKGVGEEAGEEGFEEIIKTDRQDKTGSALL